MDSTQALFLIATLSIMNALMLGGFALDARYHLAHSDNLFYQAIIKHQGGVKKYGKKLAVTYWIILCSIIVATISIAALVIMHSSKTYIPL